MDTKERIVGGIWESSSVFISIKAGVDGEDRKRIVLFQAEGVIEVMLSRLHCDWW
jgi:hypothetical protein